MLFRVISLLPGWGQVIGSFIPVIGTGVGAVVGGIVGGIVG